MLSAKADIKSRRRGTRDQWLAFNPNESLIKNLPQQKQIERFQSPFLLLVEWSPSLPAAILPVLHDLYEVDGTVGTLGGIDGW